MWNPHIKHQEHTFSHKAFDILFNAGIYVEGIFMFFLRFPIPGLTQYITEYVVCFDLKLVWFMVIIHGLLEKGVLTLWIYINITV